MKHSDLTLNFSLHRLPRKDRARRCPVLGEHILRTDLHVEAHTDSLSIPESYSIRSTGAVEIYSTSDFPNSVQLWNQQGSLPITGPVPTYRPRVTSSETQDYDFP